MSDPHPLDHPDILERDFARRPHGFFGRGARVTMRHPDITSNCGGKVGSPGEPRREPEADTFLPIDVAINNLIHKLEQLRNERARKG